MSLKKKKAMSRKINITIITSTSVMINKQYLIKYTSLINFHLHQLLFSNILNRIVYPS